MRMRWAKTWMKRNFWEVGAKRNDMNVGFGKHSAPNVFFIRKCEQIGAKPNLLNAFEKLNVEEKNYKLIIAGGATYLCTIIHLNGRCAVRESTSTCAARCCSLLACAVRIDIFIDINCNNTICQRSWPWDKNHLVPLMSSPPNLDDSKRCDAATHSWFWEDDTLVNTRNKLRATRRGTWRGHLQNPLNVRYSRQARLGSARGQDLEMAS